MNIIVTHEDANSVSGKLGDRINDYHFDLAFGPKADPDRGLDFDGLRGRISRLKVWRNHTCICAFTDGGWDVLPHADADKFVCEKIIRQFN